MQSGERSKRSVVVSVGTDHHRFDRLMDWIEEWLPTAPADVSVFVQYGSSRCPRGVEGRQMLPKQELVALMESADAILVQGGPGGIMDARRAGRLPIAVPRLAALEEVVDDHQVTFCRRMSAMNKIALAESPQEMATALADALTHPDRWRVQDDAVHVAASVERFGDAVDSMLVARHQPHAPARRYRFGRSQLTR